MIPLITSAFQEETKTRKALANFLVQGKRLSFDEQCREFEKNFAKKQQCEYAVFVTSGSSANLVLIQALLNTGRLKRGQRVGFSVLTWSTNVMPLIELGLVPVAIDCSIETLNTSPEILEKHIQEIDAFFLTNVLGFCDDMAGIQDMCQRHDVLFFEDNCEALGSVIEGETLGNFGLASTASFYIGHHMSTIEGGMICTNDRSLYEALVIVRAHGWDRHLPEDARARMREDLEVDEFYGLYTFYDLGYNCRPSEIHGFLGNIQLPYWDHIVETRQKNFFAFHQEMSEHDEIHSLKLDHMDVISNFAVPIICRDTETFRKYKNRFQEAEVEIRPIIAGNITKQPFYKKYVKSTAVYPNADTVHMQGFYFANNTDLSEKHIEQIQTLLRK